MLLDYLLDKSDTPEEFISACSKSERDLFFIKFRGLMLNGVDEDCILRMSQIGMAFHKFAYFNKSEKVNEEVKATFDGHEFSEKENKVTVTS